VSWTSRCIVAKHQHAPYDPGKSTCFKIRNPNYSQMVGREELFEREEAKGACSGVAHLRIGICSGKRNLGKRRLCAKSRKLMGRWHISRNVSRSCALAIGSPCATRCAQRILGYPGVAIWLTECRLRSEKCTTV